MKHISTAFLLTSLVSTPALADEGHRIAKEIERRNAGYGDMKATLEMTLADEDGRSARRAMRVRSLETKEADTGDRSLVIFDSPRDVKGMALLSHAGVDSDRQWLYIPAAKRVQRISSSNTSGPFVGSEFAYEDITGTEVDKFSWKLLGEAACPSGGQCYKLESRPNYDRSGYTKRIVWVDKTEYRVHQIDFFDRKNAPLKTLTYSDWKKHDGRFWRAHRWTMKNQQSGKSTELVFKKMTFANGYEESDFHRNVLKRIR